MLELTYIENRLKCTLAIFTVKKSDVSMRSITNTYSLKLSKN